MRAARFCCTHRGESAASSVCMPRLIMRLAPKLGDREREEGGRREEARHATSWQALKARNHTRGISLWAKSVSKRHNLMHAHARLHISSGLAE